MKTTSARIMVSTLVLASYAVLAAEHQATLSTYEQRVATVMDTPGCVAFWDFVKREPDGALRFNAHAPAGATNDFALNGGNYVSDYWGEGREATYADFPLLGRGPFGQAIRIRKEEDATFRPFLFVPRARSHDSPIDIKGARKSVSVVVWAIRESGNHALAGIYLAPSEGNGLPPHILFRSLQPKAGSKVRMLGVKAQLKWQTAPGGETAIEIPSAIVSAPPGQHAFAIRFEPKTLE